MKLMSMCDFVLEQVKNSKYEEFNKVNEIFVNKVVEYANFLKQPLELWMVVPCDEDGNVLEEPKVAGSNWFRWKEAKERCLFSIHKLFEETDDSWYFGVDEFSLICVEKSDTIEDLIKYNLQLTPTAIKQIS